MLVYCCSTALHSGQDKPWSQHLPFCMPWCLWCFCFIHFRAHLDELLDKASRVHSSFSPSPVPVHALFGVYLAEGPFGVPTARPCLSKYANSRFVHLYPQVDLSTLNSTDPATLIPRGPHPARTCAIQTDAEYQVLRSI